jgi:hypothetical protein
VELKGDYFGWSGSLSLGRLPCCCRLLSPGLVLGLDEQENMYYSDFHSIRSITS